ncbi:hypothetical protein GCM10010315_13270 [Streptomyces luteosporeus]|uniref:Uncharacterized protein n=1 Tax=Streptomyces luteosporeus TaxID=173856 RepID=A0ABP6G2F9_9ACTN
MLEQRGEFPNGGLPPGDGLPHTGHGSGQRRTRLLPNPPPQPHELRTNTGITGLADFPDAPVQEFIGRVGGPENLFMGGAQSFPGTPVGRRCKVLERNRIGPDHHTLIDSEFHGILH